MGQQHNEIRRGVISAAVSRSLGDMRGGGVERYSETLDVCMDPWSLPEWAFLRRERLAAGCVTDPAGAGATFTHVCLVNPAGSGLLVVVEFAVASLVAASAVDVSMATESQAIAGTLTTSNGINLDTRWANQGNEPVAYLRSGATAIYPIGVRYSHPTRPIYFELPEAIGVVVSPGFAICVSNPDDAAAIHVAYRWRERHAYTSELV